jgi:hypothetical protein
MIGNDGEKNDEEKSSYAINKSDISTMRNHG